MQQIVDVVKQDSPETCRGRRLPAQEAKPRTSGLQWRPCPSPAPAPAGGSAAAARAGRWQLRGRFITFLGRRAQWLFAVTALWLTGGQCALGVAEVKHWRACIKQGCLLYFLLLQNILIIIQLPHLTRIFCKWMQQVRIWDMWEEELAARQKGQE